MGKKKKNQINGAPLIVEYLPTVTADLHAPSEFEIHDYDAETQVKDFLQSDLEFLLNDNNVSSNINDESIEEIVTHETKPKTSVRKEKAQKGIVLSKKLKKQIMDFDFGIDLDSDDDTDMLFSTIKRHKDNYDEYLEKQLGLEGKSVPREEIQEKNNNIAIGCGSVSEEEEYIKTITEVKVSKESNPLTRAEFNSLDAQLNKLTIKGGKVSRRRKMKGKKKEDTKRIDSEPKKEDIKTIDSEPKKNKGSQSFMLFVNGLPARYEADQLKKIFDPIGGVDSVRVKNRTLKNGKVKTFGFVNFRAKESMEVALAAFQKYIINGNPINLKISNESNSDKLRSETATVKKNDGKKEGGVKGIKPRKPKQKKNEVEKNIKTPRQTYKEDEETKLKLINKKKLGVSVEGTQETLSKPKKLKKSKSPKSQLSSEKKLFELQKAIDIRIKQNREEKQKDQLVIKNSKKKREKREKKSTNKVDSVLTQ